MEGLSLALKRGQAEGKLTGIKVSRFIRILNFLFVDDILIMSKASLNEWQEINRILTSFCSATGLLIKFQKTYFLHFIFEQNLLDILQ
jgi:hypothetical protein